MRFTKRLLGLMSLFALVRGLSAAVEQPGRFDELLEPGASVLVNYHANEPSQTIEPTSQLDSIPAGCEIGEAHKRQKKYRKALIHYQQYLVIYIENEDREGVANTLKIMSELLLHHRNYAMALASYWHSYALINGEESTVAEANLTNSEILLFDTTAY